MVDDKKKSSLEQTQISRRFEEISRRRDVELDTFSASEKKLRDTLEKAEREAKEKFVKQFDSLQARIENLQNRLLTEYGEKQTEVIKAQIEEAKSRKVSLGSRGPDFGRLERIRGDIENLQNQKAISVQNAFERSMESATTIKSMASDVAKARRMEEVTSYARQEGYFGRESNYAINRRAQAIESRMVNRAADIREASEASGLISHYEMQRAKGGLTDEEIEDLEVQQKKAEYLPKLIEKQSEDTILLAKAKETQRERRKFGLDTESLEYKVYSAQTGIDKYLDKEKIREDVSSGQYNVSTVNKQLTDTANQLRESLEKLKETTNKNTEEYEQLLQKTTKLQEEFSKGLDIKNELSRQGFGGGILGAAGRMVGGLSGAVSAFGSVYQYAGVESQNQIMGIRTSLAQRANDVNMDIIGAGLGNASSIRRFITNQAEKEALYGQTIASKQDLASLLGLVGSGGQTLATAIGSAEGASFDLQSIKSAGMGFMKGGPKGALFGAMANVGANVGEIAGNMSTPVADLTQRFLSYRAEIPQQTANIQAMSNMKSLSAVMNAVPDQMFQSGLDYMKAMTRATRGFGRGTVGSRQGGSLEALANSLSDRSYAAGMSTADSLNIANPLDVMSELPEGSGILNNTAALAKGLINTAESIGSTTRQSSREAYDMGLGGVNLRLVRGVDGRSDIVPGNALEQVEAAAGFRLPRGTTEVTDRRSTLIDMTNDPKAMAQAGRMSIEEAVQAMGAARSLGAALQGRGTNLENARNIYGAITGVGRLASAGHLDSAQQGMQLMGQLTGAGVAVGSSEERLRQIMEQAFAAGFDSSASFSALVGLTEQTAKNTASTALGLDMTKGAAALSGAITQFGGKGMTEQQLRIAGQNTISGFDRLLTNTSLSFGNQMERGSFARAFQDISIPQMGTLSTLSSSELQLLNSAKSDREVREIVSKNFPELEGVIKSKSDARRVSSISSASAIADASIMSGMSGEFIGNLFKASESGNLPEFLGNLPDQQRKDLQATLRRQNMRLDMTTGMVSSMTGGSVSREKLDLSGKPIAGEGVIQSGNLSNAAIAGGGMQIINQSAQGLADAMNKAALQINLSSFKDAAEQAAVSFKTSSDAYGGSLTELSTITKSAADSMSYVVDVINQMAARLGLNLLGGTQTPVTNESLNFNRRGRDSRGRRVR